MNRFYFEIREPITIFALGNKNNNKNIEYNNLIASAFYTNLLNFDSLIFTNKMVKLDIDKIIIFLVNRKEVETKKYEINTRLDIIEINYKKFLNRESFLDKNVNYKENIYIFIGFNWAQVISEFKIRTNFILSGGSVTLRHLISPTQFKLINFLQCLYNKPLGKIVESFHNSEKGNIKCLIDLTDKKVNKDVKEIRKSQNIQIEFKKSSSLNKIKIEKREYHSLRPNLIKKEKDLSNKNKKNINEILPLDFSIKIDKTEMSKYTKSDILSYLNNIKSIIENNKENKVAAQLLIENSWMSIVTEKFKNDDYLIKNQQHRLFSVINDAKKTLDIFKENKYLNKRFPMLKNELYNFDFLIYTFATCLTFYSKFSYNNLAIKIGEDILYEIFTINFKNGTINNLLPFIYKNKENKDITFSIFKEYLKINKILLAKIGETFISILCQYPHNLFEREIKEDSYFTNEPYKLIINKEFLDEIKENIVINPSTLPMICEPNKWNDKTYGGFLNNLNKGVDIITGSSDHKHSIKNRDILYKAINSLNSIKFGINNLFLNYIKNEGSYLLENIKAEDDMQRIITLKVAETFANIPFYLNVHADWRGRIYTQSFFITYQGGDLTTALLNFWEGEAITEKGKYYLYIYGANNHNINKISKTSFINRINWVKDNYNKIINLNKELILSAENPFIFTAFCLNMREIHNNPKAIIKIPVFLDATCSGIQHLAAMLQDIELGSNVNLKEQYDKDEPGDIYEQLTNPINNAINNYGEENIEYSHFKNIKLNRNILKRSIMTKVYNVSQYGIAEQLKEKFIVIDKDKGHKNFNKEEKCTNQISEALKLDIKKNSKSYSKYIAPGKDGNFIPLSSKDIFKIANILNDQIFVLFPSLNNIYNYFLKITKVMVKLNIPLTWFTPNGIQITQYYLKSKRTTISIRLFGKNKKMVIKEWDNLLNKQKQSQAIIPNIIHSLDASHLINVINNHIDIQNKFFILTVHDCFGTHPNKMEQLEYIVKKEFVLIYSQENFLETFHNRIIQSIKDNNFKITHENEKDFVIFNETLLEISKPPKLGLLDLENIKKSRYMIS